MKFENLNLIKEAVEDLCKGFTRDFHLKLLMRVRYVLTDFQIKHNFSTSSTGINVSDSKPYSGVELRL